MRPKYLPRIGESGARETEASLPVVTDGQKCCGRACSHKCHQRPDRFTHGGPKRPLGIIHFDHDIERNTHHSDGKIGQRKIHNQIIPGSSHGPCLAYDKAHQKIPNQADKKNQREQEIHGYRQSRHTLTGRGGISSWWKRWLLVVHFSYFWTPQISINFSRLPWCETALRMLFERCGDFDSSVLLISSTLYNFHITCRMSSKWSTPVGARIVSVDCIQAVWGENRKQILRQYMPHIACHCKTLCSEWTCKNTKQNNRPRMPLKQANQVKLMPCVSALQCSFIPENRSPNIRVIFNSDPVVFSHSPGERLFTQKHGETPREW